MVLESFRRAWNKFSGSYDEYLIDKSRAYPEARNYENFEEALVLGIVKGLAERGKDIAFIEAGSGTGRYMEILGYKITPHKKPLNSVYSYDEKLSQRLKLIVGVDFSEKMIGITIEKLKRAFVGKGIKLFDRLKQEDKLTIKRASIEDTSEDMILKENEKSWTRVVCCLFGTFGNISEDAREKALKRMVEWRGSNGILIVSVFNREKLKALGYYYYKAVSDLLGNPNIDDEKGDVTTDKDFLSHWYSVEELKDLAKKTDSPYKYIIKGDKLGVKEDRFDSLRGLIIISSTEEMKWLSDVLSTIKGEEVPENAIIEVR